MIDHNDPSREIIGKFGPFAIQKVSLQWSYQRPYLAILIPTISARQVKRHNLSMPMQIRPLSRLINGLSKKWENLSAALALYFAHYHFCRVDRTLRVTPDMQAVIADHVWTLQELLA
jgi:hypothetical protein